MKLFEPGKIGKLVVKNRVKMGATGAAGLVEPDGRMSQRFIDYHVARARGGAGLLSIGGLRVSRDIEPRTKKPNVMVLMADSYICLPGFNELAEAVHDYGAKIAAQLGGGVGRAIPSQLRGIVEAVAPSDQPCFSNPNLIARGLTTEEVERAVQAFGFAAEIARNADIDAVEIRIHSGFLLDQFLTALWNKRTDKYGGNLDGRLRIITEIIEAVRRGAGADFPIIVKLALTHYLPGGREIEEGLEIARRLEAAGVDAFEIDAGCYETQYWVLPTTYQPPGCMVDLAEMVKKVVKIPVIAIGKLGYPELAERVLQEGKADFIALARPLLADPEWPNKAREGRLEDIRPCIGDNEGCYGRTVSHKYMSCTVNPQTGMDREFALKPAERKKSVLVIGGGPAGMEAARVSALRGHKVTLWEKSNALGGNLIPASVPDFKQDYRLLVNYLSTQVRKLGVGIECGKEATPELVRNMKPDVVFIATGARPVIPSIPGVEKESVATAIDVLLGKRQTGETVVVIGGGLVGCETALYLAHKGSNVTVVARHDLRLNEVDKHVQQYLEKMLADAKVKTLTYTRVSEITDEGILISDKSGKTNTLKADTIVLAVDLKPDNELWEVLKDWVPEIYAIGDCVKPRKVINAIWEGFRIARLI